ncbi:MAG: hypothetical protein QOF62_3254 [Pyrinomonadaceae bacterium]|jgi:hypothetical protein|nr:hypothetical protein [Pyrinomonadaceae bacterium]
MTMAMTNTAFSETLDSDFLLEDETRSQNLKLIKVSERKAVPPYEQFSIMFRGDTDMALEQGTFHLEHPSMGALDIFLVPVKRDEEGMYYEAIFSNIAEAE